MSFCSGLEKNGGTKYVYALFPVNVMRCVCVCACVRMRACMWMGVSVSPKAFWTTVWDILTEVKKMNF